MEKLDEVKLERNNGKTIFQRFFHIGPILTICKLRISAALSNFPHNLPRSTLSVIIITILCNSFQQL